MPDIPRIGGECPRLEDVPAGDMLDAGHAEPASGGAPDPTEPRQTERLVAASEIAGGFCVRLVRSAAQLEYLLELVQVIERGRLVPQIGAVRLLPSIASERVASVSSSFGARPVTSVDRDLDPDSVSSATGGSQISRTGMVTPLPTSSVRPSR